MLLHIDKRTNNYYNMEQDEIKNQTYKVAILQRGRDMDTLCFKLYNEKLGEFVMCNCHYNANPSFLPNAKHLINGNVEIEIDGKKFSFVAVLVICQDNPDYGNLTLKC